jgi:hypothetical protein
VAIQSPTGPLAFWSSVNFTATASATGGLTIARVEYYNGGTKIGESTNAASNYSVPFTAVAVPVGPNTLFARVVSTDGKAVASAPATLIVQ